MERWQQNVLEIVRKSGAISRPQFGTAAIKGQKTKDAADIVTEVDQAVEKYLAAEFTSLDPTIAFVGEEYGGDRSAERFWLVDPIDGTQLYVRGLPFCTTMVTLIEQNKPTMGIIYDFVQDILYYAMAGSGAFANDRPLQVSDRGWQEAFVGYESKIEKPGNLEKYLEVKAGAYPVKFMSSGYEYILVATGQIDGRITYDPYGFDYDFAPGCLLVQEAGGVVSNIGSSSYDYRELNTIAANPRLHAALTAGDAAIFPVSK